MTQILLLLFLAGVSAQNTLIPINYDITIIPETESLTFISDTKISISLEEPTNSIILSSKNLQIDELKVYNSKLEEIAATFENEEVTEILTLQFSAELTVDLYNIVVKSSGKINENYEGLYFRKFKNINEDKERNFIITDFWYDKARQVFPCFDSPEFPSTFTLSLVRPKELIAVSNMVKLSTEDYDENRKKDTFARSDAIPTYLLSFVIADLAQMTQQSVSTYGPSQDRIRYMARYSNAAVSTFKDLYPVKINMVHQVIVPDEILSRDVIENLGLIIYRESAFLFDLDHESAEEEILITKFVTHSIASQWYLGADSFSFGENFWKNEGTTRIYEFDIYEPLFELNPYIQFREHFLTDELENLLESDTQENAITLFLNEKETPSFEKFYSTKTFALYRMLMNFPKSVTDVDSNMAVWARNPGYPILTVTRSEFYNHFSFEQDGGSETWPIPINVIFQNEEYNSEKFDFILDKNQIWTDLLQAPLATWYLANVERLGYYRVNYDTRNWKNLATFLQSTPFLNDISPINRAILVEDSFALAFSELRNITFYLDLIKYLPREQSHIPVYAFIKTANHLKSLLAKTSAQEKFIQYSRELLEHWYEIIGPTLKSDENSIDQLSRIRILTWLCNFGHETCQKEMFAILEKSQPVEPNLQDLVYCGGMRLGNLETFSFLMNQYTLEGKRRIFKSMACTSNSAILEVYITAAVNGNTKDRIDGFLAVLEGSDVGVDVVLDFVKKNVSVISERFTDEEISTIFMALSKKLTTHDQLQEIDALTGVLNENQRPTYQALFATMRHNILTNIKWRDSYVQITEKWLDENMADEESTASTPTPTESSTPPTPTTYTPGGATDLKTSYTLFFVLLLKFILHQN